MFREALTHAAGVKGGVSLALPLAAAVPCAQALQDVPVGVRLAPRVPDAVRGPRVLVVTAVWGGDASREGEVTTAGS